VTFRLAVFLFVAALFLWAPDWLDFTAGKPLTVPLVLLWLAVACSMLAQLNPKSALTAGCMKQYPNRFEPVANYSRQSLKEAVRQQNRGALKVAAVWLTGNLVFGILYWRRTIGVAELVLLCALYYLCDLICVLFFCPFQTFLMGNRVMGWLAAVSMNYYLLHQNLAVHLKRLGVPPSVSAEPNRAGEQPWQLQYTLLCFGLSLLGAALITLLIEKPCAKVLKKMFARGKAENKA